MLTQYLFNAGPPGWSPKACSMKPIPINNDIAVEDQSGFILLEMLMSTLLLGTVIIVFLTSLSVGSRAGSVVDTRVEVNRLAQTQMEFALSETYLLAPASYTAIAAPPGYGVTVATEPLGTGGPDIQKITVSVYLNGELRRTLEAYKFNR